ncbi:TIGR02099 family protein [Diaphorobacter sp. HDW4A]|uniref:YhdP family protein n=1 Tax=Diaphorobacter sp. HDW4A TaxID=2714924 RepID=UPI00140C4918|nr:YhdP family protein [Diaphorobacter sp. HDW4A]QIL83004.1 TIGR02099 family protein [Diaphorobacter sp. HDW4A]
MTEQPSHPSRLLHFLAGFARWSLGLLLAFWLLVAVAWGLLHGFIVPRIGEFRQQVQTQAEKVLGVPVRIGGLAAQSEGLIPTLELSDVQLLDPMGREALRLPQVVVAVSPRSLLRWGFDQLYVKAPELDVRRDATGRIHVAGLPITGGAGGDDGAALEWLFSQGEVAILHGKVRWTDELREAPPLELTDVNLVLRNGAWRHRMRLDATPPEGWGERFSVRGVFREPILSTRGTNWKNWSGQLYADLPNGDVSRLNEYADLGALTVGEGEGAVRAWIDVRRGKITGGMADVALKEVRATLGNKLEPIALKSVKGRVGAQQFDNGFEVSVQNLSFVAADGLSWPDTTLFFRQTGADPKNPSLEQGELRASQLNLAVLAQIADRLPLGKAVHDPLRQIAPRGVARNVQATWHGPLSAPRQYQANGLIEDLSMGSTAKGEQGGSMPGIAGARVQFALTQAGGSATLAINDGALVFPGVFEEPAIPLQQLAANVNWTIDGERIGVDVQNVKFANADAAGEARASWHTADPRKSSSGSRFPGVLDLSGSATRADGTRVHRYLPLGIPEHTRHYVRDGVNTGVATGMQFKVKGNLHDFPFSKPGQGDFRIAAQVKNVNYTYVPASLQAAGELPWPQLTGLSGELVFDRSSMQVKNANGTLGGLATVKVRNANAEIPNLDHPVVGVDAQALGPLADMLGLVRKSHITQLTEHALDQAVVTGNTELRLQLSLPLDHINESKVQGNVKLVGNDVQFTPDVPQITQAQGSVQFSEGGFSIVGVQGRALGGDVKLEGGMRTLSASSSPSPQPLPAGQKSIVQVRAQGTATAEGLRAVAPAGPLADLASHATGTTPYSVQVGIRRGVPELLVNASLQGMAIDLPAPLGKSAQSAMPVRFETQLTPQSVDAAATVPLQEQLTVDVANVGGVHYVRQLGDANQPGKVLRGAIGVGLPAGQVLRLPESGVTAELVLGDVDAGPWHALAKTATDKSTSSTSSSSIATATDPELQGYQPSRINVRAQSIALGGRTLHQVDASVTRQKDLWRVNAKADELSGLIEYRLASDSVPAPGLIYARLDRLKIPQSQDTAASTNDLLDDQPRTLPALDIVVQDFEIHGRTLGRIEVLARNASTNDGRREWRLAHLNLITPEATFASSGNWALLGGTGANAQRRTVMNFELDVRDSGDLLARFNMPGVVKRGKGKLSGQVAWLGAPLSPDYPSMTGQVHVDMQAGQFLKADPGLAKLLSVLSLQSIPRRLTLDFRDVFSEGFAFDFVRGDLHIDRGVATTNNLQMKGLNAAVLMEGKADLEHETQDLRVVVVPEINAMTASLVATAINPVIGLGSFLAQVFLRGPLIQAATQEFRVDGTWSDPRVEKVKRSKAAAGQAEKSADARHESTGETQ